jgi:hypothetical protein
MLLFLMIPLTLVAFTIAIGPVLAMTVVRSGRPADDPGRIPWDLGGPQPVDLPDEAAAHREPARTA